MRDGHRGEGSAVPERDLPPAAHLKADAADQIPPGGEEHPVFPG